MCKGEVVSVDDLSGYRQPDAEELEYITKQLNKNFDGLLKFSLFGMLVTFAAGVLVILTKTGSFGALIAFMVFLAMLVYVRIYASTGRKVVLSSSWVVVNCKIVEIKRVQKGKRAIYIETALGERCSKVFVTDKHFWHVG